MASPRKFSLLILSLSISLSLFITPSHSITCKSQNLPDNRTYANCTDLPSLSATLHFTYNTTNNSLSVAFAAEPPTSTGYVAWGINPTIPKMAGTQALIAFKKNGTITVEKYNLSSYSEVKPVKELSFSTWDISAVEESGGAITIFATVKVPEKAENLSQVWQVGPVNGGVPGKHAFAPQNLAATAALPVEGTTAASNDGGSGKAPGPSDEKSGGTFVMGERFGLGFYLGLVLVMVGFMSM